LNSQDGSGKKIDWPVLSISGGLLVLFVVLSVINVDFVGRMVDSSFAFSAKYFGAFWQLLLLATFVIALILAFSKFGKVKLGKLDKPEMSTGKWISIIMCTLLAGGGVFWAAAEPMYHYMTTPPLFGDIEGRSAVKAALSQSFLHWGFLAWAILGALSTVIMMYAHYHKGMPLKPRSLLYPMFGEKIMHKSVLGTAVDVFSIIAVAAGTIGPIGFLGLQAGYGVQELFGIPNTFSTQLLIIIGLIGIAAISAVTGIHKGIQFLSSFNVIFTIFLILAVLLIGPGGFIIDAFVGSYGMYLQEFLSMSTYRGDTGWLSFWTVFFWGWFLGYGPMMAIFISRISRGRSLRQIILALSIVAPVVTNFWFTVVGGTGIHYEQAQAGSVSEALTNGGMPAAMMAIMNQLPMGGLIAAGFLLVTVLFVATTADSMSYTISMAMTGEGNPDKSIRVFWALIMGAVASVLLYLGEGSVSALQSFIVVTAVPVSFILLPTLWLAPKVSMILAEEQGIRRVEEKPAGEAEYASDAGV